MSVENALKAAQARVKELEAQRDEAKRIATNNADLWNASCDMVNEQRAKVKALTEAMTFYADPTSYRQTRIELWREMHPGEGDPIVAIYAGGHAVEADPGYALSPMQHDNNGNLARRAIEETTK